MTQHSWKSHGLQVRDLLLSGSLPTIFFSSLSRAEGGGINEEGCYDCI